MKRRAFTLIEVMVALVVTGLVVSLAYASMQAGLETSERLEKARNGDEREVVARSLLSRAIRHAVPGTIGGPPVFLLRDGMQGDELRFRTRGVVEPLGASNEWQVELQSVAGGVRLAGYDVTEPSRTFSALLPRVRRIDVRVRGRDPRDGWFDTWSFPSRSPVAVAIAFLSAEGAMVGAPLVARVGLEGNP